MIDCCFVGFLHEMSRRSNPSSAASRGTTRDTLRDAHREVARPGQHGTGVQANAPEDDPRGSRSRHATPSTTCGTRSRHCSSPAPPTGPRRPSRTLPPRWGTPVRRRPCASTPGGFPAGSPVRRGAPSHLPGDRCEGRGPGAVLMTAQAPRRAGRLTAQARFVTDRSPMPRATGSWRPRSGLDAGAGMRCS